MDSGPEQVGRAERRREPDALDLWFRRQRRAWWKRWRWVVVPLIALAALRTLYVGVWGVLAYVWDRQALVVSPSDWQYSWVWTMLSLCPAQMYSAWLLTAGAVFVTAAQARALAVPQELALALSPGAIYNGLLRQVRGMAWGWMAGLVYSSVGLGYLGYLLLTSVETYRSGSAIPLDPALLHVQPALTALLLIFLLTRFPRLPAGVVAVVALLPVVADIQTNNWYLSGGLFWPLSALVGRYDAYLWPSGILLLLEVVGIVWLGFAVARPPRGYTGAAER